MKKLVCAMALALALALPAQAVRYGIKKQIYTGASMAYPTYLVYSSVSDRMYSGNAGPNNFLAMDCAGDSSLGPVAGAVSPYPPAYDLVNNRFYYKGGNETFYAVDCATNTVDTSLGGWQGGTWTACNPDNNKIYVNDDWNGRTHVYSAADYSFNGELTNYNGFVHYYSPNNSVYAPNANPLAAKDSLGVFSGATNALTAEIYIPGMISNGNKTMASNPAASRLYLSLPNTDQMAIVNTSNNTLANTLTVGDNPSDFALCPLNSRMFFACNGNSQYSLQYIDSMDVLDSVQVGDSVSTVVYNPSDSLIYIGCWRSGYVKLVDPRLPTPTVVDSVYTVFNPHFMDMTVDNGGDVYCAIYNSDDIYVIGKIPLRIWQSTMSTGQWFDVASWQYSDDNGATWNIGSIPDCSTDSLVTIAAGTTMQQTIGGPSVTADQLIVDGTLQLINNSLAISDGPGNDIVVNGVFQYTGGSFTIDPGATMVVGPTGQYTHGVDGGTVPAAQWDSLSTLRINGVMNAMPAGMDQAFGNIMWDGTQQAGDFTLPGGPGFSARNIFILSTGPNSVFLTSAAKPELTVNNLGVSNGAAILGGGGPRKLHVKGNLEIYNPAWLYLTDTLNRSIDTLFLYGDYYHLMSGIGGGGPDSTAIVFCGTDTQSYMANSEVLTGSIDYLVRPGSILDIPAGDILGNGSLGNFTLMPGATLVIRDDAGIWATGSGGAIQVAGTRNFSKQANYCFYDGPSSYVYCGDGLPDTVNMLTINNTVGSGWYQEYYSTTVMDTFALLAGYIDANYDININGPVVQGTGYINGSTSVTVRVEGSGPDCVLPVVSDGMIRGLVLDRPGRTLTLTGNLTIFDSLALLNGTLQTNSFGLMFEPNANIVRNSGAELLGLFPPSFAGGVNLAYGGGTITAGLELPSNPYTIQKFRMQNPTDTVIVNQDTLGINDTLFLPGAISFTGSFFQKNGVFDTMGVAGELIFTDTCTASINELNEKLYLPGISGGSLALNDTAGSFMRRNITCTGKLNLVQGNLTVGGNVLTLGDSLAGSVLLRADSASSLVFQGGAIGYVMPSTVNHLSKLVWDRSSSLLITAALALHDTLRLGQGIVDNSVNLTLRSGVTTVRNSGILMMPPVREGLNDVIYQTHGGGLLAAGNELPGNATDLNNLTLSIGLLSNDTIALAGSAQINGRLSLQQGVLSVGANTLTLRDTIDVLMGQLAADSTSGLQILNSPYLFSLPASVKELGSLVLNSPAGLELADTTRISVSYQQTSGKIGFGQLIYGPAATLEYNKTGSDTTSDYEFPGIGGPRNLAVSTGGVLQLHASRTIPGTLTLSSVLNTGTGTVTVDTFGAGVQGAAFVEGNLAKLVPWTADTIIAYELGTWSGGPSPVSIQVYNNTVPAFVAAGIKGTGHPLANDSTSCLKKFWSFSGAGLAADASLITLNYLPSDFNTGFSEAADESTMVAGRYDNGATPGWQFPAVTARNTGGTADGGSIVLSHAGNFADNPEFTLGRDSLSIFNPAADTTLPYIVSNVPLDGASVVGLTDSVRITFSEPVRKSLASYTFVPNPGLVDTVWSADSTSITFNHSAFAGLTAYTVRVVGIQDTAGNALTGRDSIGFATMAAADTVHPAVTLVNPSNGATGVLLQQQVVVRFSEPMDTTSFRFRCTPDPLYWDLAWSSGDSQVTILHGDFAPGILYSFRVDSAADKSGNSMLNPPYQWSFTTVLPDSMSFNLAGGAYRMFSVPLSPVDSTPAQILGDELGAYSDSTWRIFGYKPASGYVERPNISSGYGYWLATAGNAQVEVKGTRLMNFFNQPIESGWNLIGDPFDTTVTLANITVLWSDTAIFTDSTVNSVVRQRMYNWQDATPDLVNNGAWDSLTPYNSGDQMHPWTGYALYAVQPCTLRMERFMGKKPVDPAKAPQYQIDWQLTMDIASGSAVDRGLKLGVSPQAKETYDRLDAEKPPLISNNVKAFFLHQDWNQGPCHDYQYDFRPSADYIEWPLMIEAAQAGQPVILTSQITGELGNEGYLYLLDRRKGKTFDLKTQKTIGFSGSQELAVVYSSKPFDGRTLTPLIFGLGRIGPNPFVQRTTINYQIPKSGMVNLQIYNITGQRVRTLVSQNLPPGYYSQLWDGRNDGGRMLSAGVYIVRLSSLGRSAAQKIVKLQ